MSIEKIDFSIVVKFFCDVIKIEVRYFQTTFKFDIFRFFLSPKLQHLETLFFEQKIEKFIRKKKKKNDKKKFVTKILEVRYFQITADACPKELSEYLIERSPKTLDELATWADQYLMAHNKKLSGKNSIGRGENLSVDENERSPERPRELLNCCRRGGEGHRALDCMSKISHGRRRSGDRRISCYRCGGLGHEARDCRSRLPSQPAPRSGPSGAKPPVQVHRVGCAVHLPEAPPQEPTGDGQILELKSGGSIKVIHATAWEIPNSKDKLPLVTGKVGGKSAEVLRDTGCTGVIVKKDLVSQDQLCVTYGHSINIIQ